MKQMVMAGTLQIGGGAPVSVQSMTNTDTRDREKTLAQIKALNDLAAERNQTLSQMALSWVVRNEAVTSVLIGASSPKQIEENTGILDAPAFTPEQLKRIDTITRYSA